MSSDIPRDPSLATLLDVLRDRLLADVRISLPGRVDSFDAVRGTASVTVLVDDVHLDADQSRVARPTICHDVPVLFLRGTAGGITVPVRAGDPCWVWWAGRSIEQWKATGKGGDPRDDRRHDPSDCVCLVGAFAPAAGGVVPQDAVVVSAGDGVTVKLGAAASLGVARLNDTADLDWGRIQTILDARYNVSSPGSVLTTVAAGTGGDDATISSASSKVKAE